MKNQIIEWIREKVEEAGKNGVVVGLSGGIDSSVVATLCKKAFPKNCLGIIMPCAGNPLDEEHAKLVAKKFKIPLKIVDIYKPYIEMKKSVGKISKMSDANIRPRLRMTALYAVAQNLDYLVVGTTNKTELLIGYLTKYGDGGVDIEPIADIYKTDLKKLAKELKVPSCIINKAPSAGLWEGQTDEGELGITYKNIDAEFKEYGVLTWALTKNKKLKKLIENSRHKRCMPPMFEMR